MRKANLALTCIFLAGVAAAQQTSTTSSPAKPAGVSSGADAAKPAATSTAPAHPLTDAQAHQMLEMTGALDIKPQMLHGLMNYFHTSMPFLPKDVIDDLEQSFNKLDMETPIIDIYKQHISTEDADAIIAFYKTPAGKSMIQVLPSILQQSQQIGMQMGRKTAQEVIQRHRPEIEAAAKQYQEEHAPKPAPASTTPNASPATGPSSAPAAKPASPSSSASPSTSPPQPH